MAARRILTLFSLATYLVLGVASPSWGITISWDRGGGSNLASNSLNWNPNLIPSSIDDVVLNALAPEDDQTVDLSNVLNQPGQVRRIETAVNSDNYTVNNGTIELFLTGGNALLTRGGSLTVNSDVRFGAGSFGPRFNTIAGASPIVVNGSVAPSDSNSAAVTLEITSRNLTAGPQVTITGVISDGANPSSTLALTAGFGPDSENHRGVVRVTGNNTYTGQTIVNGATLEFDSIGNVGGGASALGAPTTIASGTIRLGAIDTSGVKVPGTLTYIGTAAAQTDRLIQLEGDGGIIAPADAAGSLTLNGEIFSNNAALVSPILQLHGTGSHEVAGDITESDTIVRVVKVGTGTWRLSGNNSYTGTTTNFGGRLIVDTDSLPATGGVVNNGELEFDQTTTFGTYSGVISGSGDLIKSGIPELNLSATNSYSGDTRINAGLLSVSTITDAGNPSSIGVGQTVFLSGDSGRLRYTGTTAASTNRDFVVTPGLGLPRIISLSNTLTLTGTISGSGGAFMGFSGSIEITGTNTYSAITQVLNSSTVIIPQITDTGVEGPLGTGNTVFMSSNATLRFTGAIGATNREFLLTSSVNFDETIDVTTGVLTLNGDIVGGHSTSRFVKAGGGILSLSAANTYANGTRVEAGTLRVNNTSGSGTGIGDVTVNGFATLGGTGTISGDVQINTSGILNPGASTGTLTVDGDVNFLSQSNLRIEIAGRDPGQFDLLDVGGFADVEGLLSVDLLDFIPLTTDQFTIVTAGTLAGGFSGLLPGSRIGTFDGEGTFSVDLDYAADIVVLSDFRLSNPPTGDFDADGDVDGADFLAWQRGEISNPPSASDLADWEVNFGAAPPLAAVSTAVPEPRTIVLLALALAALTPTHRYSSDLCGSKKNPVPPGVRNRPLGLRATSVGRPPNVTCLPRGEST